MPQPLISVVVPVYKVEKYLPICIQSILNQTVSDFELLLIDDGSPDRSGVVADEYAQQDARIRVFHKPNGGVSSARNFGLEHARGQWVCFIDSDDWVEPDFLAHLLNCSAVAEFRAAGHREYTETGFREYKPADEYFMEDTMRLFYEKHIASSISRTPWGKLLSMRPIREHHLRFDTEVWFGEDTLFICSYLRYIKQIVIVGETDYHWRYSDSSLSRISQVKAWGDFIAKYEKQVIAVLLERYPDSFPIRKHWAERCLDLLFLQIEHLYMEEQLPSQARRQALASFFAHLKAYPFNYLKADRGEMFLFEALLYHIGNLYLADAILYSFWTLKKHIKHKKT